MSGPSPDATRPHEPVGTHVRIILYAGGWVDCKDHGTIIEHRGPSAIIALASRDGWAECRARSDYLTDAEWNS